MKKLLIGLFALATLGQEVVMANPLLLRRLREEETMTESHNKSMDSKFILYEDVDGYNEVIKSGKLPQFEITTTSYLEENLTEFVNNKKYNRKILYIEVIPFYYGAKAFIIYTQEEKTTEDSNTKKWWE